MIRKTLQVIRSAFRATTEEQDDTVIWISNALRDAGAALDVLLAGSAVAYLVTGQDAGGLRFGTRCQRNPPDPFRDLTRLSAKGARIYYVREDAADRGIERLELLAGAIPVAREQLPGLFGGYQHVWYW